MDCGADEEAQIDLIETDEVFCTDANLISQFNNKLMNCFFSSTRGRLEDGCHFVRERVHVPEQYAPNPQKSDPDGVEEVPGEVNARQVAHSHQGK